MKHRIISRGEVFEALSVARLACAPADVPDFLEDHHQDPQQGVASLPSALAANYVGVSNGHLSDIYEALTGERVEVMGDEGVLLECPCCGHSTLDERYDLAAGTGYDICRYCGWEDDGTSNPDALSSVNRGSMSEYREQLIVRRNFFARDRWKKDADDSANRHQRGDAMSGDKTSPRLVARLGGGK